jgi:hypothetical protein
MSFGEVLLFVYPPTTTLLLIKIKPLPRVDPYLPSLVARNKLSLVGRVGGERRVVKGTGGGGEGGGCC